MEEAFCGNLHHLLLVVERSSHDVMVGEMVDVA